MFHLLISSFRKGCVQSEHWLVKGSIMVTEPNLIIGDSFGVRCGALSELSISHPSDLNRWGTMAEAIFLDLTVTLARLTLASDLLWGDPLFAFQ